MWSNLAEEIMRGVKGAVKTLKVSKIEAARRQIDTAIDLHFNGGDPISTHTLAAAAYEIVRVLSRVRKTDHHKRTEETIRPGKEKQFWDAIKMPGNFFKHTGRDPDETLEVHENFNDFFLIMTCTCYVGLGLEATPSMKALLAWAMGMYPDILLGEHPLKDFAEKLDWLRDADRQEQLEIGRHLLNRLKSP